MYLVKYCYNYIRKIISYFFSGSIFLIIFTAHKFKLMLILLFTIFFISMFNDAVIKTDIFYNLKWLVLSIFVLFEFIIINKLNIKFGRLDYRFLIILYTIYAFFTSFFSINLKTSIFKSISFVLLIFFAFIIFPELTSEDKKRHEVIKIIRNIMLAIILLNIVILVISPSWAYKTFIHRFQGVFSNPNSLGMFLMISLPIFTYFFLTSNTKFEKGINFTFILLIIILAIFTFSRAAWLGMLVFIMCILYYIKKILFKFTFISSIILLIMLFSSPFMMELLRLSEDPFTYRDRIWQIGLENFSDSKIIGKGFGTTQQIMSNKFVLKRFDVSEYHLGKHFHNIYVEILCETGLIGLLLFALFLISISYKFIKKIKNTQNKEKIFAISIYALFIGVIFHGFFESMLFSSGNVSNIILWSLIGLALQKSNQNTQSFKNIETELLNT